MECPGTSVWKVPGPGSPAVVEHRDHPLGGCLPQGLEVQEVEVPEPDVLVVNGTRYSWNMIIKASLDYAKPNQAKPNQNLAHLC